mmetsp:Transcript_65295/g.156061  ORF Transcript_65295/g.156061 Transcript_65295/m.156061 type:complete len:436 (+) Transcript_65295:55-1362(+)
MTCPRRVIASTCALLLNIPTCFGLLPLPVQEVRCNSALADSHAALLEVRWHQPPTSWLRADVDYYEVQVLESPQGKPILISSTRHNGLKFSQADLLPDTDYWIRIRAHAAQRKSLGAGTWGDAGNAVKCRTGKKIDLPLAVAQSAVAPGHEAFTLEVMRQSEFTDEVDYLMNHNSGTVLGDVGYLAVTAGWGRSHGGHGPSGVDFTNSTLTLYCLDVLKVQVNNTFSTGGDARFSDYQSCDNNKDHSDPQCSCDVWVDRVFGGLDVTDCFTASGQQCRGKDAQLREWCYCNCSSVSLAQSATLTGMMPVARVASNDTEDGSVFTGMWFSHPSKTECMEDELVGNVRADGTQCTWKRRPVARLVRGYEIKAHGWNGTVPYKSIFDSVDLNQLLQNEQAVRRSFADRPLQPWQCESAARLPMDLQHLGLLPERLIMA